ncbi:MAG: hypothetical protein INR73_11325 [Williamsia sp.]|nr:hypothetical protein [Williamsia sp.]
MRLLFSLPGGAEWIIISVVLLIITGIFYLITLQATFDAISPENREMPSGNVWLLLIPLFGLYWHFVIVHKLAESIKAEAITKSVLTPY